jgi:luciferase family oxidoreductase group 1
MRTVCLIREVSRAECAGIVDDMTDHSGPLGVPISLLDVVPVTGGESSVDALNRARRFAVLGDEIGCRRLWYAEHHNMPGIASTAPEVLIANAAALTRRIRVGSGGVMLPNHAPLTVAERYCTLEALHPGRIDLGIGRAPGTDQRTARALRRSGQSDDLAALLAELFGYLHGFPEGHPLQGMLAYPRPPASPQIFLLGSSDYGARLAAQLGLPYAFAHHFSSHFTLAAMHLYQQGFRPSENLAQPHAILTVTVICAETDARARDLALAWALSFIRLRSGAPPGPFPTHEEAINHDWTPPERAYAEDFLSAQAIGSPETVRTRLRALLDQTGAQELMASIPVTDAAARETSLRLLVELAGSPAYDTATR